MINYILEVNYEDNFRFTVADGVATSSKTANVDSQTEFMTSYVFNHMAGMRTENNFVFIDTPGYGDTGGKQKDKELISQLETFIRSNYGTEWIDAIAFVTKASNNRLTSYQKYVFEGLLSLFDRGVMDNIFVVTTFSDGSEALVKSAMDYSGLNSRNSFKFNNSALMSPPDSRGFVKLSWDLGYESMDSFLKLLAVTNPVNFLPTAEVLEQRKKLECDLRSLRGNLKDELNQITKLNKEKEMLLKFKDEAERNKNYEEEIEISETIQEKSNVQKYNETLSSNPLLFFVTGGLATYAVSGIADAIAPPKTRTVHKRVKRTIPELLERFNSAMDKMKKSERTIVLIEQDIEKAKRNTLQAVEMKNCHTSLH